MKTILLVCSLFLALMVSVTVVYGQDTIAKFKYADAEKAFTNKNYTQAITLLNETEALLGKPAPNISHLRILAAYEQHKTQLPETFEELQKFYNEVDDYIENFDIEGLEDKYRDVYEIQKSLSIYPKLEKDFFASKGFRASNKSKNEQEAFRWNEKAAKLGSLQGQVQLGFAYRDGKGVDKNVAEAAQWFLKAAEAGDAAGQLFIGRLYYKGEGVPQNYAEAVRWYKKATTSSKNSLLKTDAQREVVYAYYNGKGVDKNYAEAIKWLMPISGNDSSLEWLFASMYAEGGYGIEKDDVKAFEWYKKAAEDRNIGGIVLSGNIKAQQEMVRLYVMGIGVAKNKAEGLVWYDKVAAKSKQDASAIAARLGGSFYQGAEGVEKDYAEAAAWYKKAAAIDKKYAMQAGACYYKLNNFNEAISWFKMATGTEKTAFYRIGDAYQSLNNFEEAIKWYTIGADSESMYAPYILGLLHYEGKGMKRNFEQALQWFEKSTNNWARLSVAMMYYSGRGVKKDKGKAIEFCRKVANEIPSIKNDYLLLKKGIVEGGEMQKYCPNLSRDMGEFFAYLDENYPEMFTDQPSK